MMDRQNAYTELLNRHKSMLWRLCWLRAQGNYERCRDLVQEVSIALWIHFDQLRSGVTAQEERAWVRWLARTTLDHRNRYQRPPMLSLSEALADTVPSSDTSTDKEYVEELMAALSPEEQKLMQMHIDGYRGDEIAEAMGLKCNTVYQRMHRAISKARKVMLAMLLTALASSVAVAIAITVVPQWRKAIFHTETSTDTIPKSKPSHNDFVVNDSLPEPVPDTPYKKQTLVSLPPITHLTVVVDTPMYTPPKSLGDPCGCPGDRRLLVQGPVDRIEESCEFAEEELPEVTIMVAGNNIIVEGVDNETVDVFDSQGRLVATSKCTGYCMLTVLVGSHNTSGSGAYWVQVGKRPRQRVFLGEIPGNNGLFRSISMPY